MTGLDAARTKNVPIQRRCMGQLPSRYEENIEQAQASGLTAEYQEWRQEEEGDP